MVDSAPHKSDNQVFSDSKLKGSKDPFFVLKAASYIDSNKLV